MLSALGLGGGGPPQQQQQGVGFSRKEYDLWDKASKLLLLLGLGIFGIGIGNVALTSGNYNSTDQPNMYTFAMVSSAVWGGAAVFGTGYLISQYAKNRFNTQTKQQFVYASFGTALLILPAMICILALEAYYCTTDGVYVVSGTNEGLASTKFGLPIAAGVLGVVAFGVIGYLLIKNYSKTPGQEMLDERVEQAQEARTAAMMKTDPFSPYGANGPYTRQPFGPPTRMPYSRPGYGFDPYSGY